MALVSQPNVFASIGSLNFCAPSRVIPTCQIASYITGVPISASSIVFSIFLHSKMFEDFRDISSCRHSMELDISAWTKNNSVQFQFGPVRGSSLYIHIYKVISFFILGIFLSQINCSLRFIYSWNRKDNYINIFFFRLFKQFILLLNIKYSSFRFIFQQLE